MSEKLVNALDREVEFGFRCVDDKVIRMDVRCCFESERIREYIAEGFTGEVYIEIPSKIMDEVNKFCVSRWETTNNCDDDDAYLAANTLQDFDYQFAFEQPLRILISLMHAAMSLRIKSLLDLTRVEIDNRIEGKFAYHCLDDKVVTIDMMCCFESENILVHMEEEFWGPMYVTIPSKIMVAVEKFCLSRTKIKHSCGGDAQYAARMLKDFDHHFASEQPLSILVQFMRAATKLRIRSLLELTCAEIVNRIKGKSDDQILKIFNFPGFTHEEYQWSLVENAWAFK